MKKIKAMLKNQKGLTLVELLAVVVILGIIAAIAVPSIGNIIDNSKKDAHIANAKMLVSAGRMAVAANEIDTLAKSNDGVYTFEMDKLVDAGYLESAIEDPDSCEEYKKAYVNYNPNPNGEVDKYSVRLEGTKRKVGAATGTGVSQLNRESVKK